MLGLGLICAEAWIVPVTEAGLGGPAHAETSNAAASAAAEGRPRILTRASPMFGQGA